ncbi:MAG: transposase, partial [Chloroflexota bacterium]
MEQHITYHFVWGSGRCKPCLTGAAADRLRTLIGERAQHLRLHVRDIQIMPDCVYVAVAAPPVLSPHHII